MLQSNGGRVLIYDIETAPNTAYVWGHWDQNVIRHKHPWYVLCLAWKWLDEDEIHWCGMPEFPRWRRDKRDDKDVVKKAWELFEEADVIVAHNGDNFDRRKLWTQFVKHDLGPPSRPWQVDTKKIAKREARFNSNSLQDLGVELGLGEKFDHGLGFDLWEGAMAGDEEMWRVMREYNVRDVELLEQVYLRLRPYMANHPNMNVPLESGDEIVCHICRGPLRRNGYRYTTVSRFQRWRCKSCGAESKTRLSFDTTSSRPRISR